VALDVRFPLEDFQGSADSDSSTFDVWEDCSVPNPRGAARPLAKEGGVRRLRGQFRVWLVPVSGGSNE